jgi:hypothetical protein
MWGALIDTVARIMTQNPDEGIDLAWGVRYSSG